MSDIGAYGAGGGRCYWIKRQQQFGPGRLELVRFDDAGEVHELGVGVEWDEAAFTMQEATLDFHSDAIAEADRSLERRREQLKDLPEPEPPMSPANRRFYHGEDDAIEVM